MADIILEQKACPLMLHEGIGGVLNCPGTKCQWWLNELRDCTLPLIARSLMTLAAITAEKGGLND